LALDEPEAQEQLAARIVAEGLSVRATEEAVSSGEPVAAASPARAPTQRAAPTPALARLAESLSDLLETRVTVELGKRKGKLVVQFASLGDLQRVIGVLAPDLLTEDPLGPVAD
jgi:ParB family chromosome partitioning protein